MTTKKCILQHKHKHKHPHQHEHPYQHQYKHQHHCKYDFIIVGMGAAGAVLVNMLSNAGFSVLGFEAGINSDKDPLIIDSTKAGELEKNYTWKYFYNQETEPNVDVNGKVMNYTTGRLLGGGTSIFGMQNVRGTDTFWNKFANINGSHWNAKSALSGFKELEQFIGIPGKYNPTMHGFDGNMKIRQAPVVSSKMATKFVNALSLATNTPIIDDYNDPNTPIGIFTQWSLFQTSNGNRASSSTNFLSEMIDVNGRSLKKNIKVRVKLNSTVNKIIFDKNKRAIGVEIISNGKSNKFYAQKEIILSAGIHSNEILQRSGIGNANMLKSLGIQVVFDNPGVGFGSKNHLISSAIFSANPIDSPANINDPNALYTGGAFLPFANEQSKDRGFQWIGIDSGSGQLIVVFYNLSPESQGYDNIQSSDPLRVSAVSECLLSKSIDLDRIVNVYQIQIQSLNQVFESNPEFVGYKLLEPSLDIINDTDLLKEYIKDNLDHAHHWTGTCKMSNLKNGGVVDNLGNVYGVFGLRVADVSISPIQPDGNTAGPAFFIGYNIAKQIIIKYTN